MGALFASLLRMLWRGVSGGVIQLAGVQFARARQPALYWSWLCVHGLVLILAVAVLADLLFDFDVRNYL